ncbi:MAG: hypothetical protein KA164_12350 [Rhodoferax sp.]|nr:hypothetical protein [Rhodoferax sp.]
MRQSLLLSGIGTSAYFASSTWYLNGEDSLGLTYVREVRDNGLTLQQHLLSANGFFLAQIIKECGKGAGLNQSEDNLQRITGSPPVHAGLQLANSVPARLDQHARTSATKGGKGSSCKKAKFEVHLLQAYRSRNNRKFNNRVAM